MRRLAIKRSWMARALACVSAMILILAVLSCSMAGLSRARASEETGGNDAVLVEKSSAADRNPNAESALKAESPTVSFLGPAGTYTEEAARKWFGDNSRLFPCKTARDAVQMLSDGGADYAVIPQENSLGGPVYEYLSLVAENAGDGVSSGGDALPGSAAQRAGIYVVGEVELTLDQNLLVLPGAPIAGIRRVYSHKQGIIQGGPWVMRNIPGAEMEEVSSTAEGARCVSDEGDPSVAAIGSAAAADLYGLEILSPAIQENKANKTRFYVLQKACGGEMTQERGVQNGSDAPDDALPVGCGERLEDPLRVDSSSGSSRALFIARGSAEYIPDFLMELENAGLRLVYLHDMPLKTVLGEYVWLVECTVHGKPGALKRFFDSRPWGGEAVGALSVSFLGAFPVV